MLQKLLLYFLLVVSVACSTNALAQDGGDKPSELLPDRYEELQSQSSPVSDDLFVEVPLLVDNLKRTEADTFIIGAIQITGTQSLQPADFGSVIEPFIGQQANEAELQALARSVANSARQKGYLFASALIPAQSVKMGVVKVYLDEGVVHEVNVKGPTNGFIKTLFSNLIDKPAKKNEIERSLLLVDDLHGFSVTNVKYVRKNGRGILNVRLSKKKPKIYATIDNFGDRSDDPFRLRVESDTTSLLSDSDWLNSQVLTTPTNPQNLLYFTSRYSNMFTTTGTLVTATAGAGKSRRIYDDGESSKTRSRYLNLRVSEPVLRTNRSNLWLSLDGGFLAVDRFYSDARPRRDDITTVTASATGNVRTAKGRISGGLSATQGLDILGATPSNDPNSSRRDGSGKFTKMEMWLNWTQNLGGQFSLRTLVNGQLASRPLLSSQEIDIGGPRVGRGFDYSEKSGDQGIIGLVELRKTFDRPIKGVSSAQIFTFVDGGYIQNLRRSDGGNSLVSGGGGVRASSGNLELSLELAVPLKGMRDNSKSPKLNMTIGFAF